MRSDLTSAAAIRDSAMALFAERGFAGVTVRNIAAAAGVSAPLVIHHYKSKRGLREAVDAHAMAQLNEMFAKVADPQVITGSASSMMSAFGDQIDALPTLMPYLRRLLVDGGEPARGLFTALFDATRAMLAQMQEAGLVSATDDPDARAAFLLVNDLGATVLRQQIQDVLGLDPAARDGIERWTRVLLDVYANGFLTIANEERA